VYVCFGTVIFYENVIYSYISAIVMYFVFLKGVVYVDMFCVL
jgi:hypothetical protein